MTFECFKDCVFDVLNHAEDDVVADITLDDCQNIIRIRTVDGNRFEMECRKTGRIREAVKRAKRKSEGEERTARNRETIERKALKWMEILMSGMFNNKRRARSKAKAGSGRRMKQVRQQRGKKSLSRLKMGVGGISLNNQCE